MAEQPKAEQKVDPIQQLLANFIRILNDKPSWEDINNALALQQKIIDAQAAKIDYLQKTLDYQVAAIPAKFAEIIATITQNIPPQPQVVKNEQQPSR